MKKEDLKITTYEDNKGYVFISYSSDDEEKVFDDFIVPLQEKYGLRIFCDKDFKNRANQSWTSQMRDNISSASACLLFISSTYASSYACLLETFVATYNKIPFLKIQLEEPQVTKIHNKKSISDSTRKEFIKIGKQLENSGFKEAVNSYLDIEERIEDGQISKFDVSKVFCEFLKSIAVTKLNKRDGLDAIKASLEQIQKEESSRLSVFEDMNDISYTEQNSKADDRNGKTEVSSENEKNVQDVNEEKNLNADVYSEEGKGKRQKSVTGDITYRIYGKEYTDNQSDMMINVFAKVLKKHEDMIPGIVEMSGMNCLSLTDYTREENRGSEMPTYFRTGIFLPIGQGVSIGTSYSVQDKVKKIASLLINCEESGDSFETEDETVKELFEKAFSSRKSGIPTKGKSGDEQYTIFGKEYSGSQTQMMIDALKALIERHFDKREELAEKLLAVKLKDRKELKDLTYFRSGETFSYQGVVYSIGTSFGRNDKLKQIKKAILICNESADNFSIEGLEINEKEDKVQSGKKNIKRDFLND